MVCNIPESKNKSKYEIPFKIEGIGRGFIFQKTYLKEDGRGNHGKAGYYMHVQLDVHLGSDYAYPIKTGFDMLISKEQYSQIKRMYKSVALETQKEPSIIVSGNLELRLQKATQ